MDVSPASTSSSGPPHLRSCVVCRHRKVKCDRQKPCSNCIRAECDCVYPSGRGRAPKRSRRGMDPELAGRLSRLESLVRSLGGERGTAEAPTTSNPVADLAQEQDDGQLDQSSANGQHSGRLMIDETRSYYVSNTLWASLANEIEELRGMLLEPVSGDENEEMHYDRKIGRAPPGMSKMLGQAANSGLSLKDREALVQELEQRLQEKHLRHCDTATPYLLLSSTVARLIIARFWLMVHYPSNDEQSDKNTAVSSSVDTNTRDRLFMASVEVLEYSSLLLTHEDLIKWTWYSKTHIQWHAVALVLSELCYRPPSSEWDRAWSCVSKVYDRWKMKENEKKGAMWRPFRRLMAKARYMHEMQETDPRRGQASLYSISNDPASTLPPSGVGVTPWSNFPMFGIETLDPSFMDILSANDDFTGGTAGSTH